MQAFDTIIVGAGSAGCVLANRLSADPARQVLLIEDGGDNQSLFIRMAGGFVKIMGRPEYFRPVPLANRPGVLAYGRGLGGSSAINGTWYLPGMPADYDGWAASGLTGWGWDEISRCLRGIENYRDPGAHAGRGQHGEQQITPSDYASPVFDAIVAAAESLGIPRLTDITQPGTQGVARSQYTVDRKGRRASAYESFVAPVRGRRNLTVATHAAVSRVLVEQGRATGVAVSRGGEEQELRAREVILCAGVFGSPHLLQLSGIGPGAEMQRLGIPLVADLPAVGQNLADHQKLGVSFDLHGNPGINREFIGWRLYRNALRYVLTGKGPLARVGLPVTALVSGEAPPDWPEFQIAAAPFAMRTVKEMTERPGSPISDRPGITFSGYHLRPRSRGHLRLTAPDYRTPPEVDTGLWRDPWDRDQAFALFRLLRRFAAAPALAPYVGAERMPGADKQSEAALLEDITRMTEPGLHGTGTCAMGLDPATSVVDARCRVHGLSGLRVVDCSIMPTPVSGNTNGPAMALAARAAELILEDALG